MNHPIYKLLYCEWKYEGDELIGLFEEEHVDGAINQFTETYSNVASTIKRFYTEDITLNAIR